MNNDYKNKPVITNTSTLARREWIETALASVRENMDASTFLPSTLESLGHDLGTELERERQREAGKTQCNKPSHLYLAWSEGQRRTNT